MRPRGDPAGEFDDRVATTSCTSAEASTTSRGGKPDRRRTLERMTASVALRCPWFDSGTHGRSPFR
jgi:hypothetical protein